MFINPEGIITSLHLHGDESVIDFGAGNGAYSIPIAKKLNGGSGHLYVVDIQQGVLSRLQHEFSQDELRTVSFISGDFEKIKGVPLKEEIADLIIISSILSRSEQKDNILAEANRLLKIDGKVLLIDWSSGYGYSSIDTSNSLNHKDAISLAAKHGLLEDSELFGGNFHFVSVLKKSRGGQEA